MDTNTTKFIISKSENNNKDMISTIDLGECKNEVLSSNSLEMNNSLYILHIQATEEGISFPIIVYEVYYKLESNNSFKNLNLEICKGIKINKTVIANISEDNMPFIHSLKENTIKATVHSSSLGGKTANCEWEFLTGNTSRFLPVGAVTYQLYVKQHVISLVDTLNSKDYYTSAFHPYKAEGYNRNIVYPLMGFQEYKFEEDLENLNYLRYDFVDDLSTYKNIIKLFEEKESNQKIFNLKDNFIHQKNPLKFEPYLRKEYTINHHDIRTDYYDQSDSSGESFDSIFNKKK